jgi:hypothetical protein
MEYFAKSQLNPSSYYAHAHMADDYIYIKLHQILDVTNSNNGIPASAIPFINDSNVMMRSTYQ